MKTLKDIKKKDELNENVEVVGTKNFSSLRESTSQEGEVVVSKRSKKKKKKIEETVVAQEVEAVEEQTPEIIENQEETETVETTTEDTPTEEVVENTSEQTETPMTDIYSAIVESVEKNREKRIYFENDDSTFVIDPSVSKIIKAVYEGLNKDNRKLMRNKLNENLSSFCKVAYFSMCKLGKIDEEI